ncbi:MAG: hypothetical protein ACOYMD_05100 [Paludibacter sp.]
MLNKIFILVLMLCLTISVESQENTVLPERTPEQEAMKQTEKLQQELNLTSEQIKQIYEINLRYARARQISNTRTEAMERIKNKNADIERILSVDQSNRLQSKRYERTNPESATSVRNQSVIPSGFRSSSEYQPTPSGRVITSDFTNRSAVRSSSSQPNTSIQSSPQSVRGNSSSTNSQMNSSSSRPQSVPSSSLRRTESSGNSSRR